MLLKVVTFNIAHGKGMDGEVNLERQAKLINAYKPDIVFLQEIDMYTKRAENKNQIREFSKKVYLPYCSMESNITFENGYYGDGIISRFPISFSTNYLMPLTDPKHEQRGILCNKIILGTAKINLFSVHLSTYEEERILSTKELMKIIDKIDDDEIIIIGGDFNVGVTRIGKNKYTYEKRSEYEEYNMIEKSLIKLDNTDDTWFSDLGQGCIDTKFYSKNITLKKFETINSNMTSDHYAIYAEFNI